MSAAMTADPTVFLAAPDRIERRDVVVLQVICPDRAPDIGRAWTSIERMVELRGRRMYGRVDPWRDTYSVCTPVRDSDDPDRLGLEVGTLRGGSFLRGRLVGDRGRLRDQLADGLAELRRVAPLDDSRSVVEYYRRRDDIELWLPILG
jgi:hypothetical protein